jgi:arylsulfatase A-like enzyme
MDPGAMPVRAPWWLLVAAWLASLAGCSGCDGADGQPSDGSGGATAAEGGLREAVVLLDQLWACDVHHRGLLFDLGGPTMMGRYAGAIDAPVGVTRSDHDGASWGRIFDRNLELTFLLPETTPVFVQLRAIGNGSERVDVLLDDALLGTLKIGKDEPRLALTRTTALPLDAGIHRISLRFRGTKRDEAEPFAELDWLRVGLPDELERTYGAPTMSDIVTPAAQLGGEPHRAVALRAPAGLRCGLRVPPHSRLRVAVGINGVGSGSAAIVVHRDDDDPRVVERVDVKGSPEATWAHLDVALNDFAGDIVDIELSATKTSGTGRLLFGDPVLLVPAVPERATPKAAAAVIVVLNGVERSDLPPWNDETPHLAAFNQLARSATVFDDHRAPSSLVAASIASLVTGLSPRRHALVDAGARLPGSLSTIAKVARDGSVTAGMFTAVPPTSKVYGFSTHWDRFEFYSPHEGRHASAPFEDAAKWITERHASGDDARPTLTLIHARGGHPPWDLTPPEANRLPPADYAGYITPRRAAQVLAKAGGKHNRLAEGDFERLRALYLAALSRQDQALGAFIATLEEKGMWDSTLLIVTGDVASARQTLFVDGTELREDVLRLPLYVHFPGAVRGGERIGHPTELYDVARSALSAVGLKAPPDFGGRDLMSVASGPDYDTQRVRVALLDDRYSVRWGDVALVGAGEREVALCLLAWDPTCAYDRSAERPIATQALFRRLAAVHGLGWGEGPRERVVARESLTVDGDTAAVLKVWGSE